MEDILKQILAELKEVKTDVHGIKEGQTELYRIVRAIEERQQIDSARLTSIEEKLNYTEGQSKRMDLDITVLKKAFVEKN